MDARSGRLAAIVFAVAVVTNFGYLAWQRHDLTADDSPTYVAPAKQLADGHGFRNAYGLPETRRTPLYPLLLAPFVNLPHGLLWAAAAQHLVNAALAVGVFWLALIAFGDAAAAMIAALLFSIDLASLHHANQILTETAFTAAMFAAAALLLRRRYAAAALVAGGAVLIRPIGLYLFVPMALFATLDAERRRAVAALSVIVAFAVVPFVWALRNERIGGELTVSTITSWSILFDRAAAALSVANEPPCGNDIQCWRLELARRAGDPPPATYSNHINRAIDRFHPARWRAIARRELLAHPLAYAKIHAVGIGRMLLGGGAQIVYDRLHVPLGAARAAVAIYNGAFALLAAIGAAVAWRTNRRAALVLLIFVVYALATTSVAESSARFRVPVMPMLAVFAGLGAHAVAGRSGR
ncbi:MAG TPA: hypothetical protein VI670_14155, partial [Thermoanaerobaculia bacterium]